MPDASTTEDPASRRHGLTTDLFYVAVARLHDLVPPPATEDPELIARFVNAGIAAIASMVPANADEIGIAARIVAADAQADDCIRHARSLCNDSTAATKSHTIANHYMRTANAARSLLLRVQAARRKREAVQATCDQDAWTVHATEGLLAAATKGGPIPAPPPPPAPPEPSAPPADDDDDKFARYTPEEQYAAIYPQRAAEIRATGGYPATARYDDPGPELVGALLASSSPLIRQYDREYAARRGA